MRVLVAQLETKHRFVSARVVNMPGGRTVPAMRAVAEPQPGVLAIGIFNAPEVILPTPDKAERPSRADIPALATIVRESNVWLTREDFDLSALAGKTVVVGGSSFNSRTAFDFLFPVSLLGANRRLSPAMAVLERALLRCCVAILMSTPFGSALAGVLSNPADCAYL